MSENYIRDLRSKIKEKEKQLEQLYEKRNKYMHNKENWYNVQCGINSISVDIATYKSRIENYGKHVNLPDHQNVSTINNHINK